jgi:hypothetical protein
MTQLGDFVSSLGDAKQFGNNYPKNHSSTTKVIICPVQSRSVRMGCYGLQWLSWAQLGSVWVKLGLIGPCWVLLGQFNHIVMMSQDVYG